MPGPSSPTTRVAHAAPASVVMVVVTVVPPGGCMRAFDNTFGHRLMQFGPVAAHPDGLVGYSGHPGVCGRGHRGVVGRVDHQVREVDVGGQILALVDPGQQQQSTALSCGVRSA